METPGIESLLEYWAHTYMHLSKLLGRAGIRVPMGEDLTEDIGDALVTALNVICTRPITPAAASALSAMTLRWLAAGDLISAYEATGDQWRALATLDQLNQIEALVGIVEAMLDGGSLN